MIRKIGLTILILTVAFSLGNCSDDFDKKFTTIGSYEISSNQQKIIKTWYLSEDSVNWQQSSEICSSNKMELVHFTTKEEERSLITLYKSFNPHPDAWVGYTDEGHEGKWTDINDKDLMFPIEFHDNEPNNFYDNEHCLQMWNNDQQLKYNDYICSRKMNFICVTYSYLPNAYTVTEAPTTERVTPSSTTHSSYVIGPTKESSATQRDDEPLTSSIPATTSAPITEASTTERITETSTTERVTEPSTTERVTQPSTTERVTQLPTTSQPITAASSTKRMTETSTTERVMFSICLFISLLCIN